MSSEQLGLGVSASPVAGGEDAAQIQAQGVSTGTGVSSPQPLTDGGAPRAGVESAAAEKIEARSRFFFLRFQRERVSLRNFENQNHKR